GGGTAFFRSSDEKSSGPDGDGPTVRPAADPTEALASYWLDLDALLSRDSTTITPSAVRRIDALIEFERWNQKHAPAGMDIAFARRPEATATTLRDVSAWERVEQALGDGVRPIRDSVGRVLDGLGPLDRDYGPDLGESAEQTGPPTVEQVLDLLEDYYTEAARAQGSAGRRS
ncbi:MAG: hypothetical protein L0Y54_23265, partial [Sporichthyaceae bacterium]|nr:hypothetical protein [Sporichthyaceae bacterium]